MTTRKPAHPTHLPSPPPSPSLPCTTLQTHPSADLNANPSRTTTITPSSPATHLDALLTTYLQLLDTYTTLRAQLSADLSSGFLSLAAANRNAATILGPGRRFGEEGFDGRMRAGRVVRIRRSSSRRSSRDAQGEPRGKDDEDADPDRNPGPQEEGSKAEKPPAETDSPTTITTTTTSLGAELDLPSSSFRYSITPTTSDPRPRDPLKWFTALPPPALRQTQTHFVAALDPVVRLLEVSARMAVVEERVREARREMGGGGAAVGAGDGDGEAGIEEMGEGHAVEIDAGEKGAEVQPSPPGPLKGQFASRSRGAEPRSRVLKMQ